MLFEIILLFMLPSMFLKTVESSFKVDYCRYGCSRGEHTVCKYKPCSMAQRNCGLRYKIQPLDHGERLKIVHYHNTLRSKVASKKLKGFGPAKKMNVISYSLELEFIAQCWANMCFHDGIEDLCRSTVNERNVGQNIYVSDLDEFYNNISLDDAMKHWEKKQYMATKDVLKHFWYYDEPSKDFLQMIWQDTSLIGCGRVKFTMLKPSAALICNYAVGVTKGLPVYEEGAPMCKHNTGDMKYLCGSPMDYRNTTYVPPFNVDNRAIDISMQCDICASVYLILTCAIPLRIYNLYICIEFHSIDT